MNKQGAGGRSRSPPGGQDSAWLALGEAATTQPITEQGCPLQYLPPGAAVSTHTMPAWQERHMKTHGRRHGCEDSSSDGAVRRGHEKGQVSRQASGHWQAGHTDSAGTADESLLGLDAGPVVRSTRLGSYSQGVGLTYGICKSRRRWACHFYRLHKTAWTPTRPLEMNRYTF